MQSQPNPIHPPLPEGWNYHVECDNAVHRIGRLVEPRGIEMFMGSQWFMVPRHFAHWLLWNELPIKYSHYARHVVVADENFFATMARNRYVVAHGA